jgi:hypothetical protein
LRYLAKEDTQVTLRDTSIQSRLQHLLSIALSQAVLEAPIFFEMQASNLFKIQNKLSSPKLHLDQQIKKKCFWYFDLIGTGKTFISSA